MLRDRFGRTIDYLRVSVIDHCNLRCAYCMPLKGTPHAHGDRLLSADEIATVVQASADLGFRKVRLTGGEPTLRADIVDIVHRIAETPGIDEVVMTTNGVLLPRLADELKSAGLTRVNLHIDSLNRDNFARLMRFGSFDDAWAGLQAAIRVGFEPIKINAVVTRGFNDQDVAELAALTLDNAWHVRFIELMPFGEGSCGEIARNNYVATGETRERIEAQLSKLIALPRSRTSDESVNYRFENAAGVVGFISPVSDPYCGDCNRMRLTADGKFHLCLLRDDEIDVRTALRSGEGIDTVKQLLRRAIAEKPIGHQLEKGESTRNREMSQIGG